MKIKILGFQKTSDTPLEAFGQIFIEKIANKDDQIQPN